VQQAKGLCLAEAALAEPVAIQTMLAVNGSVVDPDVATESGMFPPPRSIHEAAATPSDTAS